MKSIILNFIKIISIILTTSALLLNCWKFYVQQHDGSLPTLLEYICWGGNIIVVAHAIEGIIAAFLVKAQNKNPLTYGIYTFFVGSVGLQELLSHKVEALKN